MARTGRPKKETKRNKVLSVRLSPETWERLQAYALKHNQTMTEIALRGLEKELSDPK